MTLFLAFLLIYGLNLSPWLFVFVAIPLWILHLIYHSESVKR